MEIINAFSTISSSGDVPNEPCIFVNWHQHQPFLTHYHGTHGRGMMISDAPYMDGVAMWAKETGTVVVRGSSGSKVSKDALSELKDILEKGTSVCIAMDGPVGPRHIIKKGCVQLAIETGCPLVHVAYTCKKGKPNNNRWDKWIVPALFDDIYVSYSQPRYIGQHFSVIMVQEEMYTLSATKPPEWWQDHNRAAYNR